MKHSAVPTTKRHRFLADFSVSERIAANSTASLRLDMKCVVYAAKSTEDAHGSIPTQLEDCRKMAEREGWEVIGEFSDEAASAWSGDRGPQLAAAMEAAAGAAPAVLVVQHSDRLARGDGRSARHLGEIYFWALRSEVELRSVQDDSTFTNPLLTFAMGERNFEDSKRKSLAVKSGMDRRAARGLHEQGGPRPYGYRYEDGEMQVVKAEAVVVKRVFSEYVAGASQSAIARGLQADGILTMRGGNVAPVDHRQHRHQPGLRRAHPPQRRDSAGCARRDS